MTDETPIDPQTPHRPAPEALPPPERNRVESAAASKRLDALPILYLVGFLILAGSLVYLYRHPTMPRGAVQDAQRVETLTQTIDVRRQENEALANRVAQLEARPVPPPAPDLTGINGRIALLEKSTAAVAPVDLGPLSSRVKALEDRPVANLAPLQAALAALSARMDQLATAQAAAQAATDAAAQKTAASLAAVLQRTQLATRLQAAAVALEAGQPLGEIQGAPAAVARYAREAPPTESALRQSFIPAAAAAQKASPMPANDGKPFLERMWTRAQQSVTVRQGDHVLIGDPIAGILQHAREALDAGDLATAVSTLDALTGPPKAAMADWLARARSLLDARSSLAAMAARG